MLDCDFQTIAALEDHYRQVRRRLAQPRALPPPEPKIEVIPFTRKRKPLPPAKPITLDRRMEWTKRAVCLKHNIPYDLLLSHDRSYRIAEARHELFYRVRTKYGLSYPTIGYVLARPDGTPFDHSSIVHGVNKHEERMTTAKRKPPAKYKTVEIGNCTLIMGDCLEVMSRIGKVNHTFSDPPYEAAMHESKNKRRRLRKDKGNELKALTFDDVSAIRDDTCRQIDRVTTGWVSLFCTAEGVAAWRDSIEASGMRYKRACVWVKPDAAPQFNGQGPAMGAEMIVTAWAGEGISKWNSGGKRGVYIHRTNPRNRDGRHETEKPLSLMVELLLDFTNPGDLILDPFMGSGTTGVACALTGRRFIGIEKSPTHFATAEDRIRRANEEDLFVPQTSSEIAQLFDQTPLE